MTSSEETTSIEVHPAAALEGVLRFDVKSLFLFTFVCALVIALVVQMGLLGTIIAFGAAVLLSVFLFWLKRPATKRFWLQAVWGVLLPLSCLFTDPFVFLDHAVGPFMTGSLDGGQFEWNRVTIRPSSVACYAFIGWQFAMLGCSWFVTPTRTRWAAFLAGSLFAGGLFAGGVGTLLFVPALFLSAFLIGLPGLTPWATAAVYFSASKSCWRIGMRANDADTQVVCGFFGFVAAVVVGATCYFLWGLDP